MRGADPNQVLRSRFGHRFFRPGQQELVEAALRGRDALGVLPTGGGKSLCYLIPAFLLPGVTLVVSPLVSLMDDQVQRAEKAGLEARSLHSGLSRAEFHDAELALSEGRVRLLLVAPERFGSVRFRALLGRLRVSLLAVDEAHCISMWGHDFRPAYTTLGGVRARLGLPVMALTATATPRVRTDIETSLGMRSPLRVLGSFDRPNLCWAVRRVRERAEKDRLARRILTRYGGGRLVYAATRGRVERIRSALSRHGIRAEAYHAGLPTEERTRVQRYFLSDRTPLVVATNAFGMGIDRPDVRLVLHDQLPGSIEEYYQEAGRAGRDGASALCLALDMRVDRGVRRAFLDRAHPLPRPFGRGNPGPAATPTGGLTHRVRRRHVEMQKLRAIWRYARSRSCRRRRILAWFGEKPESKGCDACDRCTAWERLLERTRHL